MSKTNIQVDYKDIPKGDAGPEKNAWALFNEYAGKRDNLGTLNHLTDAAVKSAAASQIQTGKRVSLDLPLDYYTPAFFGRAECKHEVKDIGQGQFAASDDFLTINTQSSSQWDGFRHVAHQPTFEYYGGLHHKDLHAGNHGDNNGTHHWVEAGGIVGRGVLLDWASWKEERGEPLPDHFATSEIPLAELKQVAEAEGVSFKPGDILIIRSGFTKKYDQLKKETGKSPADGDHNPKFIGVEPTQEVVEWLWNNHFAAVAADHPAFEAWPPKDMGTKTPMLHDHLLARFGTPIGELWHLETLSQLCKELKRYTFFFTSAPIHIKGGVGSPPNAIAIF